MGFKTCTGIAKDYCMSSYKAKIVLAANGVVYPDGRPTPAAIKQGYAEMRRGRRRSLGDEETYYPVWNTDMVARFFIQPTELQEATHFANRYEVERKMCNAVHELGLLCGIDPETRHAPGGIKPHLIDATIQTSLKNPHFMVGPGACGTRTRKQLDRIFSELDVLVAEFFRFISAHRSKNAKKAGEIHVETIRCGIDWLFKNIDE